MTNSVIRLLGWIDHCARAHPGKETVIPTWLCSVALLLEYEKAGLVHETGVTNDRLSIYGLTDEGRRVLYASLSHKTITAKEESGKPSDVEP